MTLWIENVGRYDAESGNHTDMGDNAMLIQITDPASFPPIPKHDFKIVAQFEFLDIEDGDEGVDEFGITQAQADQLVALLQTAKERQMNVLVHCFAGICRSGAVTEVGTILGFTATNRYRQPNLRVKHLMMRSLGLTYDSDEKTYSVNPLMCSGGLWGV